MASNPPRQFHARRLHRPVGDTEIVVYQIGPRIDHIEDWTPGQPTPRMPDIWRAIQRGGPGHMILYAQVISSTQSPGRESEIDLRPDTEGYALDEIAIHETGESLRRRIERWGNISGEEFLSRIFRVERGVEAVVSWDIRPLDRGGLT